MKVRGAAKPIFYQRSEDHPRLPRRRLDCPLNHSSALRLLLWLTNKGELRDEIGPSQHVVVMWIDTSYMVVDLLSPQRIRKIFPQPKPKPQPGMAMILISIIVPEPKLKPKPVLVLAGCDFCSQERDISRRTTT